MLRRVKATSPPTMNTSKPSSMIARRVKPNAPMPFSKAHLATSSRTRGRQHVAEKDRAVGGDEFARLHALKDLPVAVALLPDLDGSFGEAPAVGGDPDRLCTVALPNHAVQSNCRRAHRRANADDKICEHAERNSWFRFLDS